jgi:alpha-1,2-mannosyltransferase
MGVLEVLTRGRMRVSEVGARLGSFWESQMKVSIPMPRWTDSLRSTWLRAEPVAVWVVYAEWAFWIGLVLTQAIGPIYADSTADWLVASAALDGTNPYADLRELSRRYDVPFIAPGWKDVGGAPWIHPRTPGALLLLVPVTVSTPETLHTIVAAVSLMLLAVLGATCLPRLMKVRWPLGVLLAALLIISGPVIRSMQFGAWSVLLALLIGWLWLTAREKDGWLAGIPLGIAIGMRLFPALLLIPLVLYRRWKVSASAVGVALVLNLLGMFVFGLSPRAVLNGMTLAGDTWIQLEANGSIIKPLFQSLGVPSLLIVAGLGIVIAAYSRRLQLKGADFDYAMALAVITMLLISPLSWEHYDIILFLVLALLLGSDPTRFSRLAVAVWVVAFSVGYFIQPSEQAGLRSLVGRIYLLLALIVVAEWKLGENSAGRLVDSHTAAAPEP